MQLRDPDPVADLSLDQAAEASHQQDPVLSLGQCCQQRGEAASVLDQVVLLDLCHDGIDPRPVPHVAVVLGAFVQGRTSSSATRGRIRNTGRPEDFDSVLSRKGREPLDVGRLSRRGWQSGARRGLPEGAQEVIEARWLGEKKEARFVGGNGERVREVGRPIHERTSWGLNQLAADPDR
jgi:hypothetical protein